MTCIRLKDKTFELFIREEEILQSITTMAARIKADMEGIQPLFISILKGAYMFTGELMRAYDGDCEITFGRFSSYQGTSSQGVIKELVPVLEDVTGRTVILIEDIVDTGLTMKYVIEQLKRKGAADVRIATLLFKPDSLVCDLKPDYIGISIPSVFIVGHGLDYDEAGRCYKDIYKLKEE